MSRSHVARKPSRIVMQMVVSTRVATTVMHVGNVMNAKIAKPAGADAAWDATNAQDLIAIK
jgi:hypothetical protein